MVRRHRLQSRGKLSEDVVMKVWGETDNLAVKVTERRSKLFGHVRRQPLEQVCV